MLMLTGQRDKKKTINTPTDHKMAASLGGKSPGLTHGAKVKERSSGNRYR